MSTRAPRGTKPLDVFEAAKKMCDLIASHPSADEIAARIQREVAGAHAKKQTQLDAIAALVPEAERDRLPGVILARLDKDGLRGFAVMAQENDAAPAEAEGELPAGARPYVESAVAKAARGGR